MIGEFAAPGIPDDLLNDADCGTSLLLYVALTDSRLGTDLIAEDRWRNRYHWYSRFANVRRSKFRYDAGFEELASRIMELVAEFDIDPQEFPQLEAAARPVR